MNNTGFSRIHSWFLRAIIRPASAPNSPRGCLNCRTNAFFSRPIIVLFKNSEIDHVQPAKKPVQDRPAQ